MSTFTFLLLIQFALTWIMVGILWFAQVIHYPLYLKIREGFIEYERSHIRRAAALISPLMILEAITAVWLVSVSPEGNFLRLAASNVITLGVIWLTTFLFQITQHQKLTVRFSKRILASLLASNWIRTCLWTIKGMIVGTMLYFFLSF